MRSSQSTPPTSNVDESVDKSVEEFLGIPVEGKWSRLKKWALIATGVIVLLLIVSAFSSGKSDVPRFATVELRHGDMMVHVTATGNLKPTNEVSVGSELSGLIEAVFVDINDEVKKNQPLAQIDTEKLEDAIHRSEAALEQARASVLQAEADVDLTRASLSRVEEMLRLSGGKVPSQAELDSARAEHKRALANLASAKASVSSAEAQLSSDHTDLAKATIRSPVDGVILSRDVEPGQTLAATFTTPQLFVIAEDLAAMKLEIKVDEADVGQVEVGQPTTFTVDAYPGDRFEAVIIRVNVGANTVTDSSNGTATAASNVVSYGAVLSVDNENLALRPGMTATATILTSHEQDVLMVPNTALRYRPETGNASQQGFSIFGEPGGGSGEHRQVEIGRGARQTIHVLENDGTLRAIPVRVGSSNGAWTIVTGEELEPGLQVVTGEMVIRR